MSRYIQHITKYKKQENLEKEKKGKIESKKEKLKQQTSNNNENTCQAKSKQTATKYETRKLTTTTNNTSLSSKRTGGQIMSQPHRPVYTKNRTTKRKRPRLHGAFKGGFSAGHFNTVGSKNGWTPSDEGMDVEHEEQGGIDRCSKTSIPVTSRISSNSVVGGDDDGEDNEGGDYYSRPGWRAKLRSGTRLSSKKKRREQKIEDYMDEEDANDWAGPSNVRQDYGDNNFGATGVHGPKSTNTGGTSIATSIGDLLSGTIQAQNGPIGKQLLRILGWRENINAGGDGKKSYLYVPMDEDEKDDSVKNRFLSSRRLKRIELKLSKHESRRLPDPKLDTYGVRRFSHFLYSLNWTVFSHDNFVFTDTHSWDMNHFEALPSSKRTRK